METLRPEHLRSEAVIERQVNTINRVLAYLDAHVSELEGELHLGAIAVACALGYIELRFSALLPWSNAYEHLKLWYQTIRQRPAIANAIPKIHH